MKTLVALLLVIFFLLAVAFSTVATRGTTQTENPDVLSNRAARCAAEIYRASDLSNEYLQEYAADNKEYVLSGTDARILKEVKAKVAARCAQ